MCVCVRHRFCLCLTFDRCVRCACSSAEHWVFDANCAQNIFTPKWTLFLSTFDMHSRVQWYNTNAFARTETYVRHLIRSHCAATLCYHIHPIPSFHLVVCAQKRQYYPNDAHHTIAFSKKKIKAKHRHRIRLSKENKRNKKPELVEFFWIQAIEGSRHLTSAIEKDLLCICLVVRYTCIVCWFK